MRASLPLMIALSAALHLCIGLGIVLSRFHVTMPHPQVIEASSSPTMELQPMPIAPPAEPLKSAPVRKTAGQPVASTPAAPPKIAETKPAAPPPPMPHFEVNPNANVRALPPEAVLSLSPPPQLDGANGVVFVLDISGSMYEPYNGATRLAFAREALAERIRELKDGTPFAIVLYAQTTCASGPLVAADKATRDAAMRYLWRDVDCGGGTNLPAGLTKAEALHTDSIVVATDGDLNDTAYRLTRSIRGIMGPGGRCAALTIIGVAPRLEAGDDRLLETITASQTGTYQPDEAAPSVVITARGTTH